MKKWRTLRRKLADLELFIFAFKSHQYSQCKSSKEIEILFLSLIKFINDLPFTINMVAIAKEEYQHLRIFRTYLFFPDYLVADLAIKINGKMTMSFLILAKVR